MKLYIKQRVFSIGDTYDVYDEWGNVFYQVKSEVFSLMDRIHIYDTRGNEVFFIRRRFAFFGAVYEIYQGDNLCAQVQQRLRFFRSELDVSSQYGEFVVEGEPFAHDFTIYNGNQAIGRVTKAYLSWGDSYELDISSYADPAFFTTLVVAIDNCLHNDSNNH